jgi:hypothetical protein
MAIPQYLVDKIRSAGVDGTRKDGCIPGRDRYLISAERLKPTPFGHSAGNGSCLPQTGLTRRERITAAKRRCADLSARSAPPKATDANPALEAVIRSPPAYVPRHIPEIRIGAGSSARCEGHEDLHCGQRHHQPGGRRRSSLVFQKAGSPPDAKQCRGGRRKSEVSGGGLQHRKSVFDDLRGIKLMKAP